MSTSEFVAQAHLNGHVPAGAPAPTSTRRLHRLAEVRRQQGMSLRTVSRHVGMDVRELRQQEDPATDLPVSVLYLWQEALGVPACDLLTETNGALSPPVLQRARMVRVMKTVAAILETATSPPIRRLAETLAEQLVEIMPELKGVGPWPAVGQRRSLDDFGRAAEHRFNGNAWRDL